MAQAQIPGKAKRLARFAKELAEGRNVEIALGRLYCSATL
jgi:hypothetical protein